MFFYRVGFELENSRIRVWSQLSVDNWFSTKMPSIILGIIFEIRDPKVVSFTSMSSLYITFIFVILFIKDFVFHYIISEVEIILIFFRSNFCYFLVNLGHSLINVVCICVCLHLPLWLNIVTKDLVFCYFAFIGYFFEFSRNEGYRYTIFIWDEKLEARGYK